MKYSTLQENNLDVIVAEMKEWCETNVVDFDILNNRKGEEAIVFYPQTNQIFISECSIETLDEELPYYLLEGGDDFSIRGPNLKSFENIPYIINGQHTSPRLVFRKCDNLDFKKVLFKPTELILEFNSMKISPLNLNPDQEFYDLYFKWCNNQDVLDMSTYKHLNTVQNLTIFGSNRRFQNLSDILETKIVKISNLHSGAYSSRSEVALIEVINKYLKLGKDYIMDFTVELIDAGFETDL